MKYLIMSLVLASMMIGCNRNEIKAEALDIDATMGVIPTMAPLPSEPALRPLEGKTASTATTARP